ncbi:head-tail adaptor protein [Neogemmobacter tilapiae]|uniref:Tail protein n=1 Tax=Neogemmobacter tilapiae TaxID=875041 RepID=A0A918WH70_9RHOB|nr:head-tail adaptor protein [Gemmobacter tilapiae]GHC46297.1 tail protein [Gemmobacter tilapiae]
MAVPHLNRALVLEGLQRVADGAGGFSETWVALGTIWGEVSPGNGAGATDEEIRTSAVPFKITVRGAASGAPSRPVAGQRFRDGARVFRILSVTERDASGRFLICMAREEEPV